MRKLFRFRIRTLLIVVALLALILGIGPRLWWRYKVNSALDATLAIGPDLYWEIDPRASSTKEDYAYLLSDHERVSTRLVSILRSDEQLQRRVNAVKTMRSLSAHSGSFKVRRQILPTLIEVACDERSADSLVRETVETIADWIPSTGVSPKDRAHIWHAAIASSNEQRIAWIDALISIGGREETKLILRFGNTHDKKELWAVYNSQFRGVTWQGLLPHLRRWITDPVIAEHALEFSVLSHTQEGREILIQFIADYEHEKVLRDKAIQQLTQTVAGIDELEAACADQQVADGISTLVGISCTQHLANAREQLASHNADNLWDELIKGLDPMYWLPSSGTTLPPETEAQYSEFRQHSSQLSLKCLRLLSGNSGGSTPGDWTSWRESNAGRAVALEELLQLVLDHPEMISHSTIVRRIVPHHIGALPRTCIPLYHQMLQSDNVTVRYWACQALLAFTDSPEAIDVAIDLIDQSKPSDAASVHPGAISMLRNRFAVNYFWDTDAWRKWASTIRSDVQEQNADPR